METFNIIQVILSAEKRKSRKYCTVWFSTILFIYMLCYLHFQNCKFVFIMTSLSSFFITTLHILENNIESFCKYTE